MQTWESQLQVNATLFVVMHETTSPGVEKYVQVPFKAGEQWLKMYPDVQLPSFVVEDAIVFLLNRTIQWKVGR